MLFTLEIGSKFAHEQSVEPNHRNILRNCHGHANRCHQQIGHRQVDEKVVSDTVKHIKNLRNLEMRILF